VLLGCPVAFRLGKLGKQSQRADPTHELRGDLQETFGGVNPKPGARILPGRTAASLGVKVLGPGETPGSVPARALSYP